MLPPGKDVMLGLGMGWGWEASSHLLHTHAHSYQSSFWKFSGVLYPIPAAAALAELLGWICLYYVQWFQKLPTFYEECKWKKKKRMWQSLTLPNSAKSGQKFLGRREGTALPRQLPSCQMFAANGPERSTRGKITRILFLCSTVCEVVDHSWLS